MEKQPPPSFPRPPSISCQRPTLFCSQTTSASNNKSPMWPVVRDWGRGVQPEASGSAWHLVPCAGGTQRPPFRQLWLAPPTSRALSHNQGLLNDGKSNQTELSHRSPLPGRCLTWVTSRTVTGGNTVISIFQGRGVRHQNQRGNMTCLGPHSLPDRSWTLRLVCPSPQLRDSGVRSDSQSWGGQAY